MRTAARVALAFAALFVLAPATASAATLVVDSTADNSANNGSCTLREAVTSVNTNADVNGADDCDHDGGTGLDTISLAATTYTIAVTSNEDNNASGDFDVDLDGGNVVIDGLGQSQTTIDANDHDRVFEFSGTGSATVQELTATDGTGALVGGIVRGQANTNLTIARASVLQGLTTGSGGGGGIGFLGPGSLTVTDSAVGGNQVDGGSGPESDDSGGGGILLLAGDAALTVSRSTISDNSYTQPDDASIGNFYGGGGIKINSGGNSATITDSTISGNNVTTADPQDTISGGGIEISAAQDFVTIRRSAITLNSVTVSLNPMIGGGSSRGGGVAFTSSSGGILHFENTTVSGNSASGSVAVVNTDRGGGIASFGLTRLRYTTVTNNTADVGLGILYDAPGSFHVAGSIVSETTSACEDPGADDIESFGANVDRGTTCHFTDGDDAQGTNPNLGPLTDNGGPTETHAIAAGSAADDRVGFTTCEGLVFDGAPLTDQRGAPRPPGPENCDAGAYERVECGGVTVNRVGTEGDDTLVGTAGADGMLGFGGNDSFNPGDGGDRVCGGNGADFVLETADGDTNQYLGDAGSDSVSLQNLPAGTYSATVGSGTGVVGGTGVGTHLLNSVENAVGSTSNDTLTATTENVANVLLGLGGDDTLEGKGGDDQLVGSSNGAAGDTIVFDEAPGPVSVNLANAAGQNTGDGTDTITTTENVTGSSSGDNLLGNSDANTLSGLGGGDTLEGRAGNDALTGGNDTTDTVVFDEAPGPVSVDLSNPAAQNTGDGTDTITTTENATGSPFSDILTGTNAANNVLSGLGGDDTLEGRAANDILTGGAHGALGDTVVFDEAPGSVSVDLSNVAGQNTGNGIDTITTTENATGSPSGDTLTGDGAANRLTGLGGGDTITGALGADQLFGNAGGDNMFARDGIGDTVDCGSASDTVETDAAGVDTLTDCETALFPAVPVPPVVPPVTPTVSALSATCAGKTVTQAGGSGPAVISGTEGPDVITGTSGPDVIAGLGGKDTIRGLGANDLICGGNAKDNLIGGAGKDRLLGEAGKDKLKGGGGRDTCAGGGGRDTGASCEKQRSVP